MTRPMFRCLQVLHQHNTIVRKLQSNVNDYEKDHHLLLRPSVGTKVVLIADSPYLRDYHGALPGRLGTVVLHSKLSSDDTGVLVNWGLNPEDRVRMDLNELRLADADQCAR